MNSQFRKQEKVSLEGLSCVSLKTVDQKVLKIGTHSTRLHLDIITLLDKL